MKILQRVKKATGDISKNIKYFLNSNQNITKELSKFIIINSTDNGRKKIIYCEKKENDLLFSYLSYQYYNKNTMENTTTIGKIKYDSENELQNKLFYFSILYKALNCNNIFITHGTFGWQQVFNSYIYRGISSITNKLKRYELENGDYCFEFNKDINTDHLLGNYKELIKTINLLPHNFTLPLLAYNIFSYTKSLYKQYGHKVDISKTDKYFALNVIPTQDVNTNKFLIEFVKGLSSVHTDKNILNSKSYIRELTNVICNDFSVFSYNSETQNLEATSIPYSIFHKAVTSNISYIYYNIKNFEDYLIKLSVPENIELLSLGENIQMKFPQTLLDDYLDFISKTLSYETYEKEKTRKEKLIKKIYNEDCIFRSDSHTCTVK